MNSSVSALTALSPNVQAVALPSATARTALERLPSPLELKARQPLPLELASQVAASRDAIRAILDGDDPRLLVVVGPCSIHDPRSALEYAERLAALSDELDGQLLLVMRAYVEKPRTTVGWKGLAYDPHLDGSDDMAAGLALSRQLMLDMLRLGLPLATELLQPLAAGYFDDLLSWAAIGARTSESQIHRELVSGLGLPVGFKNGTDGGVGIACDAIRSAAHGHRHFGLDPHGHPALIETRGNPDTHVVLRGGRHGSNYGPEQVQAVRQALESQGIATRMMVDCSHANSGKNPLNQPGVLASVLDQRLAGASDLVGVMLESHLFDGCQALGGELRYGVSITDGCLGWEGTERILRDAPGGSPSGAESGASGHAAPLFLFDVQQQVLQGLAIGPRLLPEPAPLRLHQALGHVAQGLRIVLADELAGLRVEQVGVGQQRVLVVVDQLAGGIEGAQVVHRRRQFEGAL